MLWAVSTGRRNTSIMPAYPWLADAPLWVDDLGDHLTALRRLGVPCTADMIANASRDAAAQANPDSDAATGVVERLAMRRRCAAFQGRGV